MTDKTALILGANGGVGGETARALVARGWQVRALTRTPRPAQPGITWIPGDAMDADAVRAAAQGADAIVHAVNPPGYRNWGKLVLPMLDNSIVAAEAVGARLALPGTIYNYDVATFAVAEVASPQHPTTRKGAIRVAMEQRIEAACKRGARALIVRAGDYFGPRPGGSWLSQGMITPGKPVTAITYPGARGVGHAWAYLPDVGETFAQLLEREARLPDFARYHVAGVWDADGTVMVDAIRRAVGNAAIPVRRLPWALLPLIAPFNATIHQLIEMRPFWRNPFALDNRELVETLGAEPHTPLGQAMTTTLRALGCLPQENRRE